MAEQCTPFNPRPPGVRPRSKNATNYHPNPNRCPRPPPPLEVCPPGQIRNSPNANSPCHCPPGQTFWNNTKCVPECTGGQVFDKAGNCKCPIIGQTLINGKCDCGPGNKVIDRGGISFCGKICDPKENKVEDGIGGCKCKPGFKKENDRFDAKCVPELVVPTCGPNEVLNKITNLCECISGYERVTGKCVPKCTDGKERENGFCKCPGNLIQIDGVGNCVAPPPPPPPTPPPAPTGAPTKEKNKLIATLFRALPFSGKMLGEFLDTALAPKKGEPKKIPSEADMVKKDPKFKYFKDINMQNWSIAFKSDKNIDAKLKDVEKDPPVKDSEPNLSEYILNAYRASSLGTPDNKFVKVFFDLMCAVSSIYKQELSIVYSSYFKEFIKGKVLKLFSDKSGKEDVHTYIVNKLTAYNSMTDTDKLVTKVIYGGRRKTIKHRKSKSNKKTKKHRRK